MRQTLTDGGRFRQLARVAGIPLALLMLYLAYRMLVLPTGMLGNRYSTTASPLRGFASAVFWTFKAVPWEVPSLALPVLMAMVGLALFIRPGSAGWRIVLLGLGWVAIACLPLAYLGQVEPRLLYLPEVGHSIVVAGLVVILNDFVRSALPRRDARQLIATAVMCFLALAFFSATLISFLKAQDEFQPLGYKMLRSNYEIYSDLRYRHLYPEVYIKEIEHRLQQAGMLAE
jgi:hypothetical protein